MEEQRREMERRQEEMLARAEQEREKWLREAEERRQKREREREQHTQSIASTNSNFSPSSSANVPPSPSSPASTQRSRTSTPTRDSSFNPGNTPGTQEINVYQCFSCNHEWESHREYHAGDKCPKCGVMFDMMEDENGKIVEETSTGKARRYGRTAKLIIFAVIAVMGFFGKMAKG